MRLILFDIDSTLIQCGPQVRPFFAAALMEVFGATGAIDDYDFAGKTDQKIILDLLTGVGLSRDRVLEGLPRMHDLYMDALEAGLDPEGMCLLPGVLEVLEHLEAHPEVHLGLLTGNWQRGARTKLSRFDLNRFFTFGAFGDDGIERHELPPVARSRALDATGHHFPEDRVLIVGDSVHDVACARHHGLPVLAVTTGNTPAEALEAAGADRVVESLEGLAEELARGL